MERVPGQRGVVPLDVDLVLVDQVVALQEPVDGLAVVVVLVLGRLGGLWLDEKRAGEADLVLVLGHHGQEPGELLTLPLQIRVEQRLVTLPATPQDVVGAVEAKSRLQSVLHLGRGIGENLGVGVCRGPGRVAGVGEQIGRSPQEAHPGVGHLLLGVIHHGLEVGGRPGKCVGLSGRCPRRGSRRRGCPAWRRTRMPHPSSAGRRPSDPPAPLARVDRGCRRRTHHCRAN